MATNLHPDRLILRCYGYRAKDGNWYGVCLDLNIAVQASTTAELRAKMNEAIESYLDSVLDTDDRASIPALLSRKAPWPDWLRYYWFRLLDLIRRFPDNFTFQEYIPFHLSHAC